MIVVTITPMFLISSINPKLSIIPMYRNVSMWNIPMFAIAVVPSMFRAIVGVFTAVIYVISSKYAPWILRDLVSDRRMFSQEVSYFFMLVEILAVIN